MHEPVIRPMREDEKPLLEAFLYLAIYQPPGETPIPREVIFEPEIYVFIQDFGCGAQDDCLVAEIDGEVAGMVWVRRLSGRLKGKEVPRGYGNIDDETPEYAIAVRPQHRGKGVGTALLKAMAARLQEKGVRRASLSVHKGNPAIRLYQRMGFQAVETREEDILMVQKPGFELA